MSSKGFKGLIAVMMCVLSLNLFASISIQYPLGKKAKHVVSSLPISSELVKAWPYDDELWLHHDARHLLAMEIPLENLRDDYHLFKTLDREFKYYSVYRLSPYYALVVMSRGQKIPWPRNKALATQFVADQQLLMQLYALHDHPVRHIDLNQVGKVLPLHMLYPAIASSQYSRFIPPVSGNSYDWRRLAMQVALAEREGMLSAATELIGPQWQHLSFVHRQYILGVAMLANAMMQQYPSALLLWDVYGRALFKKHQPALDIVLLRNYCLHQLSHPYRHSAKQAKS